MLDGESSWVGRQIWIPPEQSEKVGMGITILQMKFNFIVEDGVVLFMGLHNQINYTIEKTNKNILKLFALIRLV